MENEKAAMPKTQSQVEVQQERLLRALEELGESQDALRHSLVRVLREESNGDAGEMKGKVEEELVPLADYLRARADFVHSLVVNNRQTLQSLEL